MAAQDPCYSPDTVWDAEVAEYLSGALGEEAFRSINAALCQPPAACARVNTLRATPGDVLAHLRREHQACIGAGAPQQAPYIHPLVPQAVIMPRSGPAAIDYSAAGGREVVVSRKTGEAVLRGAPVYVGGVLATSKHIQPGDTVSITVAWEAPGSQTSGITRGSVVGETPHANAPGLRTDRSKLHVGLGRAEMSRADMFRATHGVAVTITQPVFPVQPVTGLEGQVMIQSLPSIVAAMALAPSPGDLILDMCAAPGGKTTVLAQLMGDQGTVIALDRTHAKAAEVMSLSAELGITCVQAYKMDATTLLQPPDSTAAAQTTGGTSTGEQEPGTGHKKHAASSQGQQPVPESHATHGPPQAAVLDPQPVPQPTSTQHACLAQQQPTIQANQHSPADAAGAVAPTGQGLAKATGCAQTTGEAKVAARLARKQAARAARGQEPAPRRNRRTPAAGSSDCPVTSQQGAPDTGTVSQGIGVSLARAPPVFLPESFDCVLLDAPCSALGLRPRLLQTATCEYLHQCGLYTRKLLDVAVRLVKAGGRLVFSTCTLSPWENEVSVRYVLDTYSPAIKLIPALPRVGAPGLVGRHSSGGLANYRKRKRRAVEGGGEGEQMQLASASQADGSGAPIAPLSAGSGVECYLTAEEAQLVQRFDPSAAEDTMGFFIAAFTKTRALSECVAPEL